MQHAGDMRIGSREMRQVYVEVQILKVKKPEVGCRVDDLRSVPSVMDYVACAGTVQEKFEEGQRDSILRFDTGLFSCVTIFNSRSDSPCPVPRQQPRFLVRTIHTSLGVMYTAHIYSAPHR
jgi:hypothetical protein